MEEIHLYQQIAEAIRRKIISAELKPGDRLPSIRMMVKQWNCTPGTVQRAYQELIREGLIRSRPGKGTHVLDSIHPQQNAHIRKAALVHRAEAFLLEVFTAGYSTEEIQQAVGLAIDRWQSIDPLQPSPPTDEIRFSGSHDLALKWLSDSFERIHPGFSIKTEFTGSLGGLLSLAQGSADLAGTHLWDPELDTYNDPFIRKIFPGKRMVAITLAHRSLGFMLLPGNPLEIRQISDLSKPGIIFVNRQSGSGTRVWLDIQLRRSGISPSEIDGYDNEKVTHSEIAQAIISGQSNVGIGLQAVCSAFDLDFLTLTQERYDLVTYAENLEREPYLRLVEALNDSTIREKLMELGGYDCRESGQIRWIG